jgi:hypothetical protein
MTIHYYVIFNAFQVNSIIEKNENIGDLEFFWCILYSFNSFQFYPNEPRLYEKYCYISTPNIFNVNLTCHLKTCKIN